jgi:hypothetical protein
LDIKAVFKDAVEDRHADAVVVVGLGWYVDRPRAKEFAAGATRLVLGIMDIEVGHLAIGQGADTTVERAFAAARFAALGAGMADAGAADDADLWHDHGLCSWGGRI